MKDEIKIIYTLALKMRLKLSEIAGKDGWQPMIQTIVMNAAYKIEKQTAKAIAIAEAAHRFIRQFMVLREKKRKKTKYNF